MLERKATTFPFALAISLFASASQAALIDLGNGLVNDTDLNITWTKDANLFKTLCDAENPIATGFMPVDAANATAICDQNGRMSWNDAKAWIDHLNSLNYLNHNDWRMPVTQPINGSAYNPGWSSDGSTDRAYNVTAPGSAYAGSTASEMAYLHFNGLGNGALYDTAGNLQRTTVCPGPTYCVQNTGPFIDVQTFDYWSNSEYQSDPTSAWEFNFKYALQSFRAKANKMHVWPVRPELSTTASLTTRNIPTLNGWGLALSMLALLTLAWRRLRTHE